MNTLLLDAIVAASGLSLYPIQSDKKGEQIIYTETPVSDDGVKNQYRLELNIVCDTLAKAITIDKAIRKALLSFGDLKQNNVLNIEINGGGTLTSEVGVHRLLYFSVLEADN